MASIPPRHSYSILSLFVPAGKMMIQQTLQSKKLLVPTENDE